VELASASEQSDAACMRTCCAVQRLELVRRSIEEEKRSDGRQSGRLENVVECDVKVSRQVENTQRERAT
jgi:hypothetical protein